MRIAAVYDIHGNLPALEAVMQEIRQAEVELIVVGGDVMPGPMPVETLDYLLNLDIPTQFIMGNGDDAVLAALKGEASNKVPEHIQGLRQWTAQQLAPEHQQVIASWPLTIQIGETLFCHATARNNTEVFTRLTAEEKLLPVFGNVKASMVICGHTHMQFERRVGNIRVVNAGSVGMPYGESKANWLLIGDSVEFKKTSYDLEQAAALIRTTSYPMAEDFAANNLLQVPSEEHALEVLSQAELE